MSKIQSIFKLLTILILAIVLNSCKNQPENSCLSDLGGEVYNGAEVEISDLVAILEDLDKVEAVNLKDSTEKKIDSQSLIKLIDKLEFKTSKEKLGQDILEFQIPYKESQISLYLTDSSQAVLEYGGRQVFDVRYKFGDDVIEIMERIVDQYPLEKEEEGWW